MKTKKFPCKNCITFAICKSEIIHCKGMIINTTVINKCILMKKYTNWGHGASCRQLIETRKRFQPEYEYG